MPSPSDNSAAYSPRLDNVRGVLWMLAAVVTLTAMFAIIKQMTAELPIFVVAVMRTATSLAIFLPWLIRGGIPLIATQRLGQHFLRSVFGTASFACVVFALAHLMLADAMILSFTTPFWSIIISALVLGEVIRAHRTGATIAGFIGVALIVKPQLGIDPYMLVALGSALLTSCAMITMKALSTTEPPGRIVFYFFLFGTLLLLPPAVATWETPSVAQFLWLAGAGILGALGQTCLARAYDAGEVTVIAPFDFMRLPFAALLGFLIFAEIPDAWTAGGTLVIVAASLYITRRERLRRRNA